MTNNPKAKVWLTNRHTQLAKAKRDLKAAESSLRRALAMQRPKEAV